MTALAAALLAAGTILALFGTTAFAAVWSTAPDRTDLTSARRYATAGRWSIALGATLLAATGTSISGLPLLLFVGCILAAALTLITKAPLRHFTAAPN